MAENILRLAPETPTATNKHTLKFDGHEWKLKLNATACGVDVAYTRERTEKEQRALESSSIFVLVGSMGNKEVTLAHDHIHPKWWWPLLFKTTESEIKRFIRTTAKAAAEYERNKTTVGKFLQ